MNEPKRPISAEYDVIHHLNNIHVEGCASYVIEEITAEFYQRRKLIYDGMKKEWDETIGESWHNVPTGKLVLDPKAEAMFQDLMHWLQDLKHWFDEHKSQN